MWLFNPIYLHVIFLKIICCLYSILVSNKVKQRHELENHPFDTVLDLIRNNNLEDQRVKDLAKRREELTNELPCSKVDFLAIDHW